MQFILLLHVALLLLFSTTAAAGALRRPRTNTSAIFVFGDSTVDSGNNDFLPTVGKSNFPPYGQDFPGQVATGRFSNGRLVTDYIVSYLGIKEFVPPYLDPTLTVDDLKTGVCFASAGTGFDPLTAKIIGVIPMEKQLENFREYKQRMEGYIGKPKTQDLLRKSTAVISAGTNDFIENYFLIPIQNKTYTISAYESLLLQLEMQFIQEILDMGIRNVAVVGLPPMGCVPAVITLDSDDSSTNCSCLEQLSAVARDYNRQLQAKIVALQGNNRHTNIAYIDIYKPVDDFIKRPQFYGFEVVDRGCCGSGVIEISILCNIETPVCSDASKYVFWDSVHPTQAAYYKLFLSLMPVLNRFFSSIVT